MQTQVVEAELQPGLCSEAPALMFDVGEELSLVFPFSGGRGA